MKFQFVFTSLVMMMCGFSLTISLSWILAVLMPEFLVCWNLTSAIIRKNTVTSYVSRVKNSKTDNYGAEDCDENKHETETSITYLGTTEKYYKNASVSIPNLSTGKHTLTMYYMERGMWESNMAAAFNFPDNNELQVQKRGRSEKRY